MSKENSGNNSNSRQGFRLWFIGHAHIDAVWLWNFEETIRVVENTFKSVLEFMEKYPWLTYAQSSALYYKIIEEKHPELFKEIVKKVNEGRWEVVGGSWVEFDAYMPLSESIARQFLYGQKYFKEKFGKIAEVGWLPDTFGYPNTLPQVMAKSGIKYFYTQKPLWNDIIQYPLHVFYWESPDGSRVLTYIGLEGYSESLNEDKLKEYFETSVLFKILEGFDDHLILFGAGDHGGGPRSGDVKTLLKWLNTSDLPVEIRVARSIDFFKILEKQEKIPVSKDELYVQYHRGVFTTQSRAKSLIRKNEVLVDVAERLSTIASLLGYKYPREKLEYAWKNALLYQFHDSLSGTCIKQVYEDLEKDYRKVEETLTNIINETLKTIELHINTQGPGKPILVFNPLTWNRRELIEIDVKEPGLYEVVDEKGNKQITQLSSSKALFIAEVPSLGYRVYWLKPSTENTQISTEHIVSVEEREREIILENRWIIVVIDKDTGIIREIHDKELGVNIIKESGVRIRVYEDNPVPGRKTLYGSIDAMIFDAWEIYVHHQPGGVKYIELLNPEEVKVVEKGPYRGIVRVKYRYRQEERPDTLFLVNIIVDSVNPVVKLEVDVDWHTAHRLAKLMIPLSFYSEYSVAGAPFGYITRRNPYSPESTLYERAKYEAPFQGYISCTSIDGKQGVSVITSSCRGYEHTGYSLNISLLRSARYPPRWGSPTLEWLVDREFS